ncbi:MAG: thermonuclease family protein [Dehalococcoidia bacterium]
MSSKRRNGTVLAILVLAVVTATVSIPYLFAAGDARRPEAEAVVTKLDLPPGVSIDSLQKAYVEEVVDGDTADVLIDGRMYRVRYYGVDTPERGQKCFREATDRNQQLVVAGENVYLLKDAREFDEFNRLLRYVFLKDGTSVDATLVAEGYGEAWRRDGRYRDQIIALQSEAETANRGCLATID